MTAYYLPREDTRWEADAELSAARIRSGITDHLHLAQPPVFVDWLQCDGLDGVGSPLAVPKALTAVQRDAHTKAVEALVNFLEHLDIDDDALEARVETDRRDRAATAADEELARRKENW